MALAVQDVEPDLGKIWERSEGRSKAWRPLGSICLALRWEPQTEPLFACLPSLCLFGVNRVTSPWVLYFSIVGKSYISWITDITYLKDFPFAWGLPKGWLHGVLLGGPPSWLCLPEGGECTRKPRKVQKPCSQKVATFVWMWWNYWFVVDSFHRLQTRKPEERSWDSIRAYCKSVGLRGAKALGEY